MKLLLQLPNQYSTKNFYTLKYVQNSIAFSKFFSLFKAKNTLLLNENYLTRYA